MSWGIFDRIESDSSLTQTTATTVTETLRNKRPGTNGASAERPGVPKGARPSPGSRLAEAFETVGQFPALNDARQRVIQAATADLIRPGEIVETIEGDIGLSISAMRTANNAKGSSGEVSTIAEAADLLGTAGLLAIAGKAPVFDFFEPNGGWEPRPPQFRLHALATQRAAQRIAEATDYGLRGELSLAALLHDVGRLVVSKLHAGYQTEREASSLTPEQRVRHERDQLGIDHALVGGVLARRWNLPRLIAVGIERHHAEDAEGLAAIIGVADMVAHYGNGEAIAPQRMTLLADRCGLSSRDLRSILYELPGARVEPERIIEPCPLSPRELDVLRLLSDGMVYKQIAGDMHLSVSTVRTHLHNVYGKVGAVDRAQAVLISRDRGWI